MATSPETLPTDRRRQILDAAVAVFAARGHDDTRIQDVADAAGVAYGLVYHYFGTKDRLLATVFDENWATFADVVEGLVGSPRAIDDLLRAMVDYVLGAVEAYPDRIQVILVEYGRLARRGQALTHPDVARAIASLSSALRTAQAKGVLRHEVDPEALPVLLLGALQAAIVAMLAPGNAPPIDRLAMRSTLLALVRGTILP